MLISALAVIGCWNGRREAIVEDDDANEALHKVKDLKLAPK